MSALTDLFTAMANKIRSKTGTQTTYTPAEMVSDGIDDVFDAGVASVPTPTSITPSNSSPVTLTANTPVNPTASGYAIESYSDIDLAYSAGVPLYTGAIYRAISQGYAIDSFQVKTPSKSGISFDPGYVRMNAGGYAYSARPNVLDIMNPDKQIQLNLTGSTYTISVTQKPRYIILACWNASGSAFGGMIGIVDVANNTAKRTGYWSSAVQPWENWSGYTGYFTSITSSSIVFKANFSTNPTRNMILVYY